MLSDELDAAPLYAVDTEFCHAVMRAAKVFRDMGSKLEAAAAEGGDLAPLIAWLRSGNRPIAMGERLELVDLLSGQWSNRVGRSPLKYEDRDERRRILDRYDQAMAELKAQSVWPRQDQAIAIVVGEFPKFSTDKVRDIIKNRKK